MKHRRPASWIIRDKETKQAITEIHSESLLKKINTQKYEAISVIDYLGSLNSKTSS